MRGVTVICIIFSRFGIVYLHGCLLQNLHVPSSSSNATGSALNNGAVLMITCKKGYGGIGDEIYKCINDTWVGDYKCLRLCEMIHSLENGKIINKPSNVVGSSIVFECNAGYTMNGESSLLCRADGKWGPPDPPACEIKSCGEFGDVQNGNTSQAKVDGRLNVFGNTIKVTCNDGYVLSGHPEIHCRDNGKWDSKPVCKSSSCGSHVGSKSSCIDDVDLSPDGSLLSYICMSPSSDISVTKVGSGTPVCSNGAWDEPDTGCFCDCKVQANFNEVELMDLDDGKFLKHGRKLNWTCIAGYRKENISDIICIDGSYDTPKCVHRFGATISTTNISATNSTSTGIEPAAKAGIRVWLIVISIITIVIVCIIGSALILFKRIKRSESSETPKPSENRKDKEERFGMIPRSGDKKNSKGITV